MSLEDSITHVIPYADVALTNTVLFLSNFITHELQNVTLPHPCVTLFPEQSKTELVIHLRDCFPRIQLFSTYVLYSMAPLFHIGARTYIDDFATYVRIQGSRCVSRSSL